MANIIRHTYMFRSNPKKLGFFPQWYPYKCGFMPQGVFSQMSDSTIPNSENNAASSIGLWAQKLGKMT
jgi:hypothetical protein